MSKIILLFLFLFWSFLSLSQEIPPYKLIELNDKLNDSTLISKYRGDNLSYPKTIIYLALFNDSTYFYRLFEGCINYNDEGYYNITDSSILLRSNQYKRHPNDVFFPNQQFRIVDGNILLFTEEQEKGAEKDYYQKYYILKSFAED